MFDSWDAAILSELPKRCNALAKTSESHELEDNG